jgi:hypothetical protein
VVFEETKMPDEYDAPSALREELKPLAVAMSDAASIPATEKAPTTSSRLVPHQPSNSDIVRQGEEAMARLANGQSWEDWVKVMRALDSGRSTAMLEANKNEPQGPRYREAFRKWLRCHPAFEVIHKSDRSRFLKCFDNLEEINEWRKNVPADRLLKLNYPSTVLSHWDSCKKKQEQAGTPPGEDGSAPGAETPSALSLAIWKAGKPEIKARILEHEGRSGLMKLLSPALLAELEDALIGQGIHAASTSTTLAVNLTKLLHEALSSANTADGPIAKINTKLKSSGRHCHDVLVAINTRMKRKRPA